MENRNLNGNCSLTCSGHFILFRNNPQVPLVGRPSGPRHPGARQPWARGCTHAVGRWSNLRGGNVEASEAAEGPGVGAGSPTSRRPGPAPHPEAKVGPTPSSIPMADWAAEHGTFLGSDRDTVTELRTAEGFYCCYSPSFARLVVLFLCGCILSFV